jgi:hypothetical protein
MKNGAAIVPAFDNKEEFKAWKLNSPNLYLLLDRVVFHWRGNAAKVRGRPDGGVWSAHTQAFWMEQTQLSKDQVKRGMAELQATGLIERERHRFAGCNNLTWVRPTRLALRMMGGRPTDEARLGKPNAPPVAPPHALPLAPPVAPTDYTSFPYHSKKTTVTTGSATSSHEEGKEGFGGEKKKGTIIKLPIPKKEPVPATAVQPVDDVDVIFAKMQAKKAVKKLAGIELLKQQYPVIEGPHKAFVKHPGEYYGWEHFASWSPEKRAEKYAQYLEWIENWKAGKKAKTVASEQDYDNWTLDTGGMADYEEAMALKHAKG